jgi:hypothetical protein
MNADNTNRETGITLADGGVRSPYQAPQLAAFGKLVTLTQTGTMIGMEDNVQNDMCFSLPPIFNVNMTFNMC